MRERITSAQDSPNICFSKAARKVEELAFPGVDCHRGPLTAFPLCDGEMAKVQEHYAARARPVYPVFGGEVTVLLLCSPTQTRASGTPPLKRRSDGVEETGCLCA